MPRPHQPRTIGAERNLAERIARERRRLGLSYEALARRLTEAGCPLHATAIHKVEKADPPRGISVDELVALATVFETTADDLLTPIELLDQKRAHELINELDESYAMLADGTRRVVDAIAELVGLATEDEELYEYVFGHLFPNGEATGDSEPRLFEVDDVDYDPVPFSRAFADFYARCIDEAGSIARATHGVSDDA